MPAPMRLKFLGEADTSGWGMDWLSEEENYDQEDSTRPARRRVGGFLAAAGRAAAGAVRAIADAVRSSTRRSGGRTLHSGENHGNQAAV